MKIDVFTYDIATKKKFQMMITLIWTINAIPTYGMLLGESMAKKLA